ncbi:uncharacterized protein RCO7_09444 [Rhynchosporium graminicola]|uniref:Myb-like domain-containing protein n=1 Tax=Rhynchosporium graminicola TaxID=2792576 RepID=A0A1E1K749_9HELO|nr:uncharacterized protein RCO7_09444 [Rhynchosporium commune]
MFINAEPRYVSNGFETFVPYHRAEALHSALVEMTNNDINAWSIFRPVVPQANDDWEGDLDEYGGNENFHVHSLYGGYHAEISSIAQNKGGDLPRNVAFSQAYQPQYQSYKTVSKSQPLYQQSVPEMSYFEQPSPMLGHDYSQMSLGRGRGSFAEFSSVRDSLMSRSSRSQIDTSNSALTSSDGLPHLAYAEEEHIPINHSTATRSPRTLPSSHTPPRAAINHQTVGSMPATKTHKWQGTLRSSKAVQNMYEDPFRHDGLPTYREQQYDPWGSKYVSKSAWNQQCLASNTISPKMLTLNVSSTSLSSSASSQGSVLALSEPSPMMSVQDLTAALEPEPLQVVEPQPTRPRRQILPDSPTSSRRFVPVVPSNDLLPSTNTQKRSIKVSKIQGYNRRRTSTTIRNPPPVYYSPSPSNSPQSSDAESFRSMAKAQAKTKSVEPPLPRKAMMGKDARDDFLVASKLAGMSYKDIRRVGNYTEAESTLRGRFRTLTKDKKQRVRKPEWTDNDVRLLKQAVRKLTQDYSLSTNKIPWKHVAEYISRHGGSYHFGNATCRKRWDDLEISG